jgi:hypothetical protein
VNARQAGFAMLEAQFQREIVSLIIFKLTGTPLNAGLGGAVVEIFSVETSDLIAQTKRMGVYYLDAMDCLICARINQTLKPFSDTACKPLLIMRFLTLSVTFPINNTM